MSTSEKKLSTSQPEKIEVERGAWKFERWLDKQKTAKELADIEYKKNHPDRYFVAFVELTMPFSTAPISVWPRYITETFLFEQPLQPSLDEVVATAKKAWGVADKIDITNFYEMNETDYKAFLGDESGWTVIEE